MRDFSKPRVYVFSAHLTTNTHSENRQAHCDLSYDLALAGVPFQECKGSYKGVKEDAYIVTGVSNEHTVKVLSTLYGQETYLVVTEHDRDAFVVSCETGYHTHVGKLVHVGDQEPANDSWTHVGGEYYTTSNIGPFTHLPTGL